jgi:hypothetical protein
MKSIHPAEQSIAGLFHSLVRDILPVQSLQGGDARMLLLLEFLRKQSNILMPETAAPHLEIWRIFADVRRPAVFADCSSGIGSEFASVVCSAFGTASLYRDCQ